MGILLIAAAIAPSGGLLLPGLPGTGLPLAERWRLIEATPRLLGSIGNGSAVVVGRQENDLIVLTADHVVRNNHDLRLEFRERGTWPNPGRTAAGGAIQTNLIVPDIAVLRFRVPPDETYPQARLATVAERPKRFPYQGISVGATNGAAPTALPATVTAKKLVVRRGSEKEVATEFAFFWETEQETVAGRSGGPLFDTEGRVIGLCAATTGGRGFYAHTDEILVAVKQAGLDSALGGPVRPAPDDRKNR